MMKLKACPRCGGDVTVEEINGDAEFVCLQCGNRRYAVYRLDRIAYASSGQPPLRRTQAA
jgi:DNA-directed RNA polymerase subunit RPC12/RpoP